MDEKRVPTILRKKLPAFLEEIKNTPHKPKDTNYAVHLYLQDNDLRVTEEGSEIVDFLRGKNVLITGGTGFLGKLLLEKLLRSSKDIGTVYLIIRTKKGINPQNRLKDFLDNFVFYKLAEIYPNFREKVVGIPGDFEEDGIGLSEESKEIIRTKVNIIYHIAATVRFDERLTKAVHINLRGTLQMIKLAHECKKLESFTYMSTAFSNCSRKHIDEVCYQPYMDPYQLMKLVEDLPEDIVHRITPGLLGDIPNTYAFTKQIAEDVVRRESAGLPLCIQRPSIVIASVREPIRSWIDNIFGPVGVMQAAAIGVLHVICGNRRLRCDLVPADYVINHCIACSHAIAKKNKSGRQLKEEIQKEIPIYNFASSDDNITTWYDLFKSKDKGIKLGSTRMMSFPALCFTSCLYWYYILEFCFHTIPSYILDYGLILKGDKPIFRKIFKKISIFVKVFSYFTLNSWTFGYQHTTDLWYGLTEVDKKNFDFDLKNLDWVTYFDTYYVALREILLQEPLDNLLEGQRHTNREVQNEIPVYNFTSSDDNPTKWGDLSKSKVQGFKMGSTRVVNFPSARLTSCLYWFIILEFCFHAIPSYILDYVLILKGEKPIFRKAFNKISIFVRVFSYFTLNSWTFGYQHTTDLWCGLNEVDKKNFDFDMKNLDWDKYFDTYYVALREILLQEPLDNLVEGQRHVNRFAMAFYIIGTLVLGLSVYYLINTIFFFIPVLLISILLFFLCTS